MAPMGMMSFLLEEVMRGEDARQGIGSCSEGQSGAGVLGEPTCKHKVDHSRWRVLPNLMAP